MAGAKNRRQGAAAASQELKAQESEVAQAANGNGSAHVAERNAVDEKPEKSQENIFLLWPNIIGTGSQSNAGCSVQSALHGLRRTC